MSMWGQQGQGGYAQPPGGGPPQQGGAPPPQGGYAAPPMGAPPPPMAGQPPPVSAQPPNRYAQPPPISQAGYGQPPPVAQPPPQQPPMAQPGPPMGQPPQQQMGQPGPPQQPRPAPPQGGAPQQPPVAQPGPPMGQNQFGGMSGQPQQQPPPLAQPGPPNGQQQFGGMSGPPQQPPMAHGQQFGAPPQQPPMAQPPMAQPAANGQQFGAPPQQPPMAQPGPPTGQQQYGGMGGPPQQPPLPQSGAHPGQPPMQQPQMHGGAPPQNGFPQGPPGGPQMGQPMQPGQPGRGRHARPGMPQPGGAMPGMAPPQMAEAPRSRGIDPDAVPSPVAVEAADIEKYSKQTYSTASRLVPPLPNTPATIVDDGNCSPRVMRSSMYVVPANKDLQVAMGVPLTVAIQPLADTGTGQPVPRVDHGPDGPIRCTRCKAYVNPGWRFIDGGRRYRCNFCDVESQVPERYFSNLDGAGNRHDLMERPELISGSVEYIATQVYCSRPSQPASYLFMIDVTYNSVKCGLVAAAAQAIQSVLDSFPKDVAHGDTHSNTRIGIITFGGGIQFYNLTAGLGQPQMMVVTDVGEPFVPLNTGLFVNIHESREIIENLLVQLPHMFEHTKGIDSFFGAAVDVAVQAMEGISGRMIVFSSSFPTIGPGALKPREDFKMLGTDSEKNLFVPATPFYAEKAELCVKHGIAVDLFMCQSVYADIATIGLLSHKTGGTLIRNFGFQSHLHAEKLINDVRRIITRTHGHDGIMRVRTSLGLRPVEFYGAFHMSNTSDIEFAGLDEDKSVVLECRYDDKLNESNGAAFQAALLYTTATGQRLIRVHTLALGVGNQIADVFRATDMPVIINALARNALREARMFHLKDLREQLRKRCIKILAAYRKHCAGPNSPAGQLILPDCLKLLPLYTGCLGKLDALRGGGTVNSDDRMTAIFRIMSLPIDKFLVLLYPQLYQIDDMVPEETGIPDQIRPSYERLKPHAAYLLENGQEIVIWFGSRVSPSVIQKMVGAPAFQGIDTKLVKLPQTSDPLNTRINKLIAHLREKRQYYMPLSIAKQKDPTEVNIGVRLAEDKGNASMSYVDFLCAIHRDIQTMLA